MSAQTERLKRRLAAIPQAVRAAVEPSLIQSGQELADTMKRLAPKRTGALADSITMTPPGQSTPPYSEPGGSQVAGENQVLITAGNTRVRYAHLQEYGTRKARAQPFFWPAYRLLKKRLQARIKRNIRKAVKEGWADGRT